VSYLPTRSKTGQSSNGQYTVYLICIFGQCSIGRPSPESETFWPDPYDSVMCLLFSSTRRRNPYSCDGFHHVPHSSQYSLHKTLPETLPPEQLTPILIQLVAPSCLTDLRNKLPEPLPPTSRSDSIDITPF